MKRATNIKLNKYRPHNNKNSGRILLKYFAEASKDEKQIVIKMTKPIPFRGLLAGGKTAGSFCIGGWYPFLRE
jgi:hypothetical protein